MNVIITAWPETYRLFRGNLVTPVVDPDDIKVDLRGVVKTMSRFRIDESLWLRLLGLQATKDWDSTRGNNNGASSPKTLRINLGRAVGNSYGHNYLVVWRDGNRRLCEFTYEGVTVGKFTWVIKGFPIGKIPRKPRKKHPKPPIL